MIVATISQVDGGYVLDVEGSEHVRDTLEEVLSDIKVLFGEDATVEDGTSVVVGDPPATPPADTSADTSADAPATTDATTTVDPNPVPPAVADPSTTTTTE